MVEIPSVTVFSGDSWDECSKLIHDVRTAAYREGKIRDQAWMADLASIHFMGEALAWYARLPRGAQEDWSKLQAALANQWSAPETGSRCARCACSPGAGSQDAALSENATAQDGKSVYLARGLLKAVVNGSGTTMYVQGGASVTYFHFTESMENAARFRFESQSTSTLLEFVDSGKYRWLAVNWENNNPHVGQGSADWGNVSAVDPETMKSSFDSSGPVQILKFRFLSSGEVVPVWRDGNTETDLMAFVNGTIFYLASDLEPYIKKHPQNKRVTLSIQTIKE